MKKISCILAILAFFTSMTAWSTGRIQNEDVKSSAELVSAGSDATHMINDTKIYATGVTTAGALSTVLGRVVTQVLPWSYAAPATGDNSPWVSIPFAHTLTSARVVAKTAGTTASTINIYRSTQTNIDGTPTWVSIFSTALTLDANERSSNTAAVPAVISSASGAANDHYKMEVTTVGTGLANITVELIFTMN